MIHSLRNTAGFGLIGVLLGALLLAVAIALAAFHHRVSSRSLASIEGDEDILSVRRFVRSYIDCNQTLNPAPAACASGGLIRLKQSDGSILVQNQTPYTTVALKYRLKATCLGNEIHVFLQPNATIPSVATDTDWVDLFDGIPIACPSTGGAPPPPPGYPAQPSYCFSSLSLGAPQTISTEADLAGMVSNKAYVLANDITLSAGFAPLPSLTNITFDGGGHTIRNFTVNNPGGTLVGLIGMLTCSRISNLNVDAFNVQGGSSVGALVGTALQSGIVNCSVGNASTITGTNSVGGLVGTLALNSLSNNNVSFANVNGVPTPPLQPAFGVGGLIGTIDNSWEIGSSSTATVSEAIIMISGLPDGGAAGGLAGIVSSRAVLQDSVSNSTVNGGQWAGGLVGLLSGHSFLDNVTSGGNVSGTITEIGGLVGRATGGSGLLPVIWASRATGTVTATTNNAFSQTIVGGLVGWMDSGELGLSSATGQVVSRCGPAGGLIGYLSNNGSVGLPINVHDSYSKGNVNNSNVCIWQGAGGLIGQHAFPAALVTNTYSAGNVSSPIAAGGLVGISRLGAPIATSSYWDLDTSGQASSPEGTGLSDPNMQVQSSFVGWDFTLFWKIPSPVSYPKFRWE